MNCRATLTPSSGVKACSIVLAASPGSAMKCKRSCSGAFVNIPGLQIETALAATLTQLQKVGTGEGVVNTVWHTYGIMQHYTPTVVPSMREARQQRGGLSFETINRIHVPIALFAMAMLPIILVIGLRAQAFSDLRALTATVGVAFLSNAFICGALSNPHHRYGARLIWLAPLVVILAAAPLRTAIRDLTNVITGFRSLAADEPGR